MKVSWKRFRNVALAIATMALLFTTASRTLGSGGGECDDFDCTSFFSPEIIQTPQDVPFFLADTIFYEAPSFGVAPGVQEVQKPKLSELDSVNLDEWAAYLNGIVPKYALSELIYDAPASDLPAVLTKYNRNDRLVQAVDYLKLAKDVEPIATRHAHDDWQQRAQPEHVAPSMVNGLIDMAENGARKSDKFLAQRYRLQAIRLMFYSGQFSAAQQYFDQNKDSFTEENSPKYRFMDVAAGSYYKDKKYGKADYLYSILFDRFAPLRRSAYFSFHPVEDADWNETLALAKNMREREVLWQLLGIYADGVAAIDKIYSMDPKSKLLPLLLVREVNRAEHDWTANLDPSRFRYGSTEKPRLDSIVVGTARLSVIKAIADAGNADKPFLWNLAAGHLMALAGDSPSAQAYISKASKSMPNVPDIQAQARMSMLFARVRAIQSIDRSQEPFLAQELTWLQKFADANNYRAANLDKWVLEHLSGVYRKGGDTLRSLMLNDETRNDVYRSVSGVDSVLAFTRNASSPFDRFLVANYRYSSAQIQELRGLQFLYAGDFTNAIAAFKMAGDVVKKNLNADPFIIHIKDCHDCDFDAPHTKYTKLSFAERMLAISQVAQGQGQAAAAASFALANGFYNMSYYGNGRDIYDTDHGNLGPRWGRNREAELSLSMNLAQRYYLQAFNLSTAREFRAQAAFMAAKTEQNRYYNTRNTDKDPQPHSYFKTLKDSFADTQYYKEIIRECGTFKSYLGIQ